jgi:hypothetical protein
MWTLAEAPEPVSQVPDSGLGEAFPSDERARFLLHDRGTIFDAAFGRRSRPSVSRPSARHLARPGRTPTSNTSSARSAASIWTTSSSSMSGIFVEFFGPTSICLGPLTLQRQPEPGPRQQTRQVRRARRRGGWRSAISSPITFRSISDGALKQRVQREIRDLEKTRNPGRSAWISICFQKSPSTSCYRCSRCLRHSFRTSGRVSPICSGPFQAFPEPVRLECCFGTRG